MHCEGSSLFFLRKDVLDLRKVIEIVSGHHVQYPFESFFAALRVHAEVLPLFWR